jgi:CheY-like chemotaxis protein
MSTFPRILVVDDDAAIRHLMTAVLSREGMSVETAENGLQALEKIRQSEYSVVLLDLMMPVVSGFDVLRHLNEDEAFRDVHVVVVTAASERDIASAGGVIVCDVVRKPFDLQQLVLTVRRCVDGTSRDEHARYVREMPS